MVPNDNAIFETDSSSEDGDDEMNVISNKMRDLQQRRLQVVEKWATNRNCDQQIEKNSDVSRMNTAMATLRMELAGLLSQDNAIFEQLLTLRRTISQLKQQSYEEDDTDDPEVTYLSVGANGKHGRQLAPRKTSIDSGSCLTSFEHSSEESAFSVESSESTSPSTSPLPIVELSGGGEGHNGTGSDHWNDQVTFPLDPQSTKCYNLGKSKSSSNLILIGCGEKVGGSRRRKSEHYLPFRRALTEYAGGGGGISGAPSPLVRSTSITVLPRGVLVRRESSFDSGFHALGLPSYGEVFV